MTFGSRGFGVRVPKGSWRFSQFCILPHGAKVPRRLTSFAFLEAPLAKREGGRGLPRPSSGNPSKQNAATATVPGGPINQRAIFSSLDLFIMGCAFFLFFSFCCVLGPQKVGESERRRGYHTTGLKGPSSLSIGPRIATNPQNPSKKKECPPDLNSCSAADHSIFDCRIIVNSCINITRVYLAK